MEGVEDAKYTQIPDQIRATLVGHIITHGPTMEEVWTTLIRYATLCISYAHIYLLLL